MEQQREWLVSGLDCPVCAAALERACAAVPGIRQASANPATGKLHVLHDETFDPAALAVAARRAGHPLRSAEQTRRAAGAWPAAAAVVLAAGVAAEAAGRPLSGLYLLAAAVGGLPLLPKAWAALRARFLDMNVLMATAMVGALGLGDWREAAVLAVLFAIAGWLERRSLAGTGRAVESLLELAPRRARVERGGELVEVTVGEVAVGERVRVRPGDLVPLDGVIVDGRSAVDQAAVTGESVPVDKGPGDPVFAATTAVDGALTIEVRQPSRDSTIARVVKLVEEAELAGSPTARVVDKFAAWYTPCIVGLAVLTVLLPTALGQPFQTWFYRALVLLVIGCPCAIVIATPVAVQSGLTAAARSGVLVRGGAPLEACGTLRAVAIDKTGTLTAGRPVLQRIVVLDGTGEDEALAVAAGLEADSTHPLGVALRSACAERGVPPAATGAHRAVPGRGVVGEVAGREWRLGSAAFLSESGLATDKVSEELAAAGLTTMWLADDRARAVLALADEPRAEAAATVAALKQAGLGPVVMLTGDQEPTARAIAALVGVDEVRAGLLPEQKTEAVRALGQQYGTVAMVGDGINDAPALAAATVGIAVGAAGSQIAMETADVALLGDELTALPKLIDLSRRVRRTIAANIAVAFAIRLVLVPLALTGHASLWLAILGDMGGSLAVTANSLRLLRHPETVSGTVSATAATGNGS